ncbi:uracil-DNA glycosylase family protein [Allorhodopirellula solitaria]|uniref:Uracil DNA glycosylase superfamily protein n=1 Tax=Allorhodopirellula solitaria TaxID=2527987 RepID=A0A5C5XRQ0_9BACT|nr:uracil-DNA glycosylase family protein [Allorhodopirellula solitaria]TWT65201.1 Uracil DNA glycosylase superfamily protein [Allorhodopirellula solitaria]
MSVQKSKPRKAADRKLHVALAELAAQLRDDVNAIQFSQPVTHLYNPLDYAWDLHQLYIAQLAATARVLFLGMNPGPWGMAQTGVPFGEIAAVRDWMQLHGEVDRVENEHPKRPIEGLACQRSEVSGRRLWGLMQERFESPSVFFQTHYVLNYCPLVFMESSGRNRTPDKLPADERLALQRCCDEHLRAVLDLLPWTHVVGVGVFAETCLKRVAGESQSTAEIARILHPSPASPAANRDWPGTATKQLEEAGVWS